MTTKNAMVMLFSFGLLATTTVMGVAKNTSSIGTAEGEFFLSNSDSVEIAERGSGRIDPDATSGVLKRHLLS